MKNWGVTSVILKKMWNHRIIKNEDEWGDWYGIHEVYYKKGEPWLYSEEPLGVSGETIEELKNTHEQMAEAFTLPILTENDFRKTTKKGKKH